MSLSLKLRLGLITVLVFFAECSDGADLLFMMGYTSYSHRVSMQPLANALAERGHNVMFMTPISLDKGIKTHPKVMDMVPKGYQKFILDSINSEFNVENRMSNNMPHIFSVLDELNAMACQILFESQEFKAWLDISPNVDLIVTDYNPDCAIPLAYKFNAKIIIYNTLGYFGKYTESLGIPAESGVTNALFYYKPDIMTLSQRIKNALVPLGWAYYESKLTTTYKGMMEEHLNMSSTDTDKLPNLQEMIREKVDLVLATGNYISEQPRSLPPMFVSVPGLHFEESHKPLSQELEKFISSTTNGNPSDGFIYISLGTVVITPNLPRSVLDAFFDSIRAFPRIRFLWRWNGEIPKDAPENLYMAKWFQQQDVFNHPKIRGFITQGGRPSIQEALRKAIPMIIFPVLGDQDFNAGRMESIGSGITLEINQVTKDQVQGALSRILYDKDMKSKVKENSFLFNDLPMKPMNTAIWWVEYALRHQDLSHLKPLARHQSWFQRRLLDVWLTLFCLVLLVSVILILLVVSTARIVTKLISNSQNAPNKIKLS